MSDLELSELYEVAARAQIHERCAMAYLHDIRGSMQALFSAIELLSRSARPADSDPARIDKACALARRALNNHEKATLEALQALTLQHTDPISVDVGTVVSQVVHFLRNEASLKNVLMALTVGESATITIDRPRFQALIVGLVTAAIDATPAGQELSVSTERLGDDAVITIGCDAGYSGDSATPPDPAGGRVSSRELIRVFAHRFLTAGGGRFDVDPYGGPRGSLRLVYPASVPGSRSLAASRESLTEK